MKYSKATNYALHTMAFLTLNEKNEAIGVEQLAKMQNLSPTYLSKILTKLVKAGLIESTPGVKGGYRLLKRQKETSFLDVIQAIEGQTSLFHCSLDHKELPHNHRCLIEQVMMNAEAKMKADLDATYIADIARQMKEKRA
jgi:Rrf2 family protein